jgi:hypothetical protein
MIGKFGSGYTIFHQKRASNSDAIRAPGAAPPTSGKAVCDPRCTKIRAKSKQRLANLTGVFGCQSRFSNKIRASNSDAIRAPGAAPPTSGKAFLVPRDGSE